MSWGMFKFNRESFEFIITLIAVLGFFALSFFKGVDVTTAIPLVVGGFLTSKTITKGTAIYSASKDPGTDTRAVIKDVEGLHQKLD